MAGLETKAHISKSDRSWISRSIRT